MTAYNITTTINPNVLKDGEAIVTLGSISGSDAEFAGTTGNQFKQYLTYHFLAAKDTPETLVVNSGVLPPPGSAYNFGNTTIWGLRSENVKAKWMGRINADYDYWAATVSYTNRKSGSSGNNPNVDEPMPPIASDPYTLSTSTRFESYAAITDIVGTPIVNTAGQPFDTPLNYEYPIYEHKISRNEYTNPLDRLAPFNHCLNSVAFWGYSPRTVFLQDINISENRNLGDYQSGVPRAWKVDYTLAVNTRTIPNYILDDNGNYTKDANGNPILDETNPFIVVGWDECVLSAGLMQKNDDDKLVEIKNDQNLPMTTPQLLNANGKWVGKDNATPHYLVFQLKPAADFNLLNLPNPYF